MTKTNHVGIHIDGALKEKDLTGMLSTDDGKVLSDKQAREYLISEKNKGYEVFVGCDNRNDRGSCAGHEWQECYWCDKEVDYSDQVELPDNRGIAHPDCAEEFYCVVVV